MIPKYSIDLKTGNILWLNGATSELGMIDQNGDNYEIIASNIPKKSIWMASVFNTIYGQDSTKEVDQRMNLLAVAVEKAIKKIGDLTWVDFYNGPAYSKEMLYQKGDLFFPCSKNVCDEVCIPNNLDHAECTGTCQPWEWLCPISNICIPKSFLCDGYQDCSNGEDEFGECPYPSRCDSSLG